MEKEKPKFLTKKQREQLKKEQETLTIMAKQKEQEEIRHNRKEYIHFNKQKFLKQQKKKEQEEEEKRKRDFYENDSQSRSNSMERRIDPKDKYITSNTRAKLFDGTSIENERESLKNAYLGLNKEKKKILKPSEKFKNIFNFDWDATDDTSQDVNPLYQHRHEGAFLFGRGLRAGIDVKEQKNTGVDYRGLIQRFSLIDDPHNYDKNKKSKHDKSRSRSNSKSRSPSSSSSSRSNRSDSSHKKKKRKHKGKKTEFELEQERQLENIEKEKLYQSFSSKINVHERDKVRDLGRSVHWSEKSFVQMTERDWRIYREDHDIIIKGGRVPKPMRDWDEINLTPNVQEAIRKANYKKPTAIQSQAIPIGLIQKDMIGLAPTGSGKSAAFLIPMINYIQTLPPLDDETSKDGPYCLILAPSRELVVQIDKEFQKFSQHTNLRSLVVVGGRKAEEQAYYFRKGCEVLIATPGRLKDALQTSFAVLNQVCWVILDEADKMVDMGFEEDVNYILDQIPHTNLKSELDQVAAVQEKSAITGERTYRVTHLYSATMPLAVEKLAKKYLRCFCYISIGDPGIGKKEIEQRVELITENQKKKQLQAILTDPSTQAPIIVFVNQKTGGEYLLKIIERWGWKAVIYHGSKTQQQREAAVDGFKKKKYDILVATDLAQRGLDVEGVQMVINFDAPKKIEDFVHRTGRTGRAGKKGIAVTFLTAADEGLFYDLRVLLEKNGQDVPYELAINPASKIKPGTIEVRVPKSKQIVYTA